MPCPISLSNAILPGRIRLADKHRHQRIVPQLVVIVEIFVALGNPNDPLTQHRSLLVNHISRITRIGDAVVNCVDQTKPLIDLLKKQRTCIARQFTTIKIGDDGTPSDSSKIKRFCGTLCHVSGLVV